MNEPIVIPYKDRQYVRWDWRVWTDDGSEHPNGLRQRITDIGLVTQLEKAYSDQQRTSTTKGPRPVIVTPGHNGRGPVVRKPHHQTPREKRQNGRAE